MVNEHLKTERNMSDSKSPVRIGVGGPVGSGKTALLEALCKALRLSLIHI